MSDSSRTQVYYLAETTWGVTPSAAMTEFRVTGESLAQTTQTVVSEEIRSDRQNADVVRTQISAGGSVNFELSYGTFDDILEGALNSDWTTAVNISATDIAFTTGPNTITSSSTDFTAQNLNVGQHVKIGGSSDAENNVIVRVNTIATNVLGVTLLNGDDFTAASAGDTITIKGEMLRNGTTKKSFTLEKLFSDITAYQSFTGMRVGQMAATVTPGSILSGSFTFDGKQAAAGGSTVGTGSPNAATTTEVMNAVDNVSNVNEGGAVSTLDFSELSFNLNNANRPQPAIANLANVGIGTGTVEVTGTLVAYFENNTLLTKYLNYTSSSLSFQLADSAGNIYVFTFPQLKYTDGQAVAGGKDQDVMVNLTWTAYRNSTYNCTIQIDRIAA